MAYATLDDLDECGLPAGALSAIQPTVRQKALDKASAYADGFLRDQATLPLTAPYDPSLVDAVCQIAAWRLLCLRGFNPDNPGDQVIRQGWSDAVAWLTRVANQQVKLKLNQAQPIVPQPDVFSNQQRGYGDLFGTGGTDDPAAGSNWGV